MAIDFTAPSKRIEDIDLPRIGATIGVGEDIIHAVMDTETAGKSDDGKGRLPALYEPHRAFRNFKGAARDEAVRLGLAYPKWKRDYPKDSYPRIHQAMAIDETAALMSASWGLPQILGENFALAGYDSPQAMIHDFTLDEDNQLEAMVRFIVGAGLDDELRVLEAKLKRGQPITPDDARPFVRGYNGSGYEANNYHVVFARNVNKWAKIPDTPYDPATLQAIADAEAAPAAAIEPATPAGTSLKERVTRLQLALKAGGVNPGNPDGMLGKDTVTAFQIARKLRVTGRINNDTFTELNLVLANV